MNKLTANDLHIGHCYSGKRKVAVRLGADTVYNDRQIMYCNGVTVQYDGPTVKPGQNYPKVPVEKFLKWAEADVSELMPKGKWRDFNGAEK